MITFNILGAVMIFVALGVTIGVRHLTGMSTDGPDHGPETIMFASMCIFFYVTYRTRQSDGHWISPFGGGNIFFIPVWGIGCVWVVVGIVQSFTRDIPVNALGLGLIGLLITVALGLTMVQLIFCDYSNLAKLFAGSNSEPGDERILSKGRTVQGERRCPECKLPFKDEDLMGGRCPSCGQFV